MTRTLFRSAGLALLSLAVPATLAAQGLAPDQTGTGGGPATTITAPNTNSLGVTKPPGTSLGPSEVPPRAVQEHERARLNKIERSICDGCN